MRERVNRAQGAREFLRLPIRILNAIFICSLTVSGAFAQGNSAGGSAAPPVAHPQSGTGTAVQLEGHLQITYQDMKDGHHRLFYTLKQSDGIRVPLQFANEPPTHLLTGDHVLVSGQQSGGGLILFSNPTKTTGGGGGSGSSTSGDATGSTASSIPVPNSFGTQYTLVMLVNFQDDAIQPYTVADAQSMFFGTANSFILENSYNQTSLTGDVVGWFTIPVSVTTCDTSQISTAAQNAATAAGVNLSAYTRYVYAFPQDNACGFGGASDVGGNPSESWINGTTGPGGTVLDIHVIDHELGHAFGLWHSHLLECGSTAIICSSPTIVEYGDPMDVMGVPQTASPDYNAYQKERLGWLNYGASPAIQTVTTSGTYTINPYELSGSGPKALKIFKGNDPTTGAKMWYYLEARQAVGFDAFLVDPANYTQNETTGVLFHVGTDGNASSGDMLDMTPETQPDNSWFDMSLAVGQNFSDAAAGVAFTPTSVTSSGATVQITVNGSGGSSCTAANPTVSVSPNQSQYVASGAAVNFAVLVQDNDSSSCPAVTFDLSAALPSGWAGVWNTTAVSLTPGKSGSATLTVTSPVGTADGSYGLGVSAINSSVSSYSGSAAATYVINTSPLSIGLTTNQSTYLPGQTVAITVTILYGTSPDAGAAVSLTITSPSGRSMTLSGTTGSTGIAALNYKLSNSATAGTYQVQAQLGTSGGHTKGSVATASSTLGASASFTVQ